MKHVPDSLGEGLGLRLGCGDAVARDGEAAGDGVGRLGEADAPVAGREVPGLICRLRAAGRATAARFGEPWTIRCRPGRGACTDAADDRPGPVVRWDGACATATPTVTAVTAAASPVAAASARTLPLRVSGTQGKSSAESRRVTQRAWRAARTAWRTAACCAAGRRRVDTVMVTDPSSCVAIAHKPSARGARRSRITNRPRHGLPPTTRQVRQCRPPPRCLAGHPVIASGPAPRHAAAGAQPPPARGAPQAARRSNRGPSRPSRTASAAHRASDASGSG
jgi:hypothetical protein